MIKGSDPILCNEYVIISAHLDHLGMIPFLIEGANDNNSSSAAMLGVAEALAKSKIKPKRSIIFMSVDGEEAGLTGSTYYTNHPLVPKDKVIAILNLEQVGVGQMLGANYHYKYPELAKLSQKANAMYVHRRLFTNETHFLTRPRTDGAVFMKDRIITLRKDMFLHEELPEFFRQVSALDIPIKEIEKMYKEYLTQQ